MALERQADTLPGETIYLFIFFLVRQSLSPMAEP